MPTLLACHHVAPNRRDRVGVWGQLKEYIFKVLLQCNCLYAGVCEFFSIRGLIVKYFRLCR